MSKMGIITWCVIGTPIVIYCAVNEIDLRSVIFNLSLESFFMFMGVLGAYFPAIFLISFIYNLFSQQNENKDDKEY